MALAKRQKLDKNQAEKANEKIMNRIFALSDWSYIKNVHIYLPIQTNKEVDTWPLIKYIWGNYPNIKFYAPKANEYAQLKPSTKLKVGSFGNMEPDGKTAIVGYFDLIIVPVLGFDKDKFRLGYGGGYYDRFLSKQAYGQSVGLAYSFCEIKPSLPRQPHDVPLDIVITDKSIK